MTDVSGDNDRMKARIERLPTDQARDALRKVFYRQALVIDETVSDLWPKTEGLPTEEYDQLGVVLVMMRGVSSSIQSIILLTSQFDMGVRDCFGIARSISESTLNVSYILAVGPDAAQRARRHAMQRSYRAMLKLAEEDGESAPPPSETIAGMPEALAEFTRRNGTKITDWAEKSVGDKQRAVLERFPGVQTTLSASTATIYRDASEVLHGSLYGAEIFWAPVPRHDGGAWSFDDRYVYQHLMRLFMTITGSVNSMLEVVSEAYQVPDIVRKVRGLLQDSFDLLGPDLEPKS